jgi:hypothetical protein
VSLFDLSVAVALVADSTANVTRVTSNGHGTNGRALGASRSTIATGLTVSLQPVQRRLDRESMGLNERDVLFDVFISIELQNKDRVVSNGQTYEVEKVWAWNRVSNHCEALVRMLDTNEV